MAGQPELSDRFDAWLTGLDVPASEKKLERKLREMRRVERGKPAKRKPSAMRAQKLYAKGLAKSFAHNKVRLTGLRSASAPDVGTLGTQLTAPRLLPKAGRRQGALPALASRTGGAPAGGGGGGGGGASPARVEGSTLPERSFPLAPSLGANAFAKLQEQLARGASLEHCEPPMAAGHAAWGLLPDGVAAHRDAQDVRVAQLHLQQPARRRAGRAGLERVEQRRVGTRPDGGGQ